MITKEQLAARIDGRMIGNETTKDDERDAEAAGLVIVFGASDDTIEFFGALDDELGAPGEIPITTAGLLLNRCDDEDCPYFTALANAAPKIEALWGEPDQPTWTYRVPFPHATFDIMDDDDLGVYCRGFVFALADVGR